MPAALAAPRGRHEPTAPTGRDRTVKALILAALAASLLAPSPGFAREPARVSTYTAIGPSTCHRPNRTPPERLGEHEEVVEHCRGPGGLRVDVTYLGAAVEVAVRPLGAGSIRPQLGTGYGLGPRIEWRGRRDAKGFTPQAAILRLQSKVGPDKIASVLAVVRIEPGAACPMAWIDAAANADANGLARRTADAAIEGFRCGADRPRIVGTETELAQEMAARAPNP